MSSGGDSFPYFAWPLAGLDNGSCTVVHTNDHRCRSALASQLLHDKRSRPVSFAYAAYFFGADKTKKSSLAKRFNGSTRKYAFLVNLGRGRRNDICNNIFQLLKIGGHCNFLSH